MVLFPRGLTPKKPGPYWLADMERNLKEPAMRDAVFGRIYEMARKDRDVIFIAADMGSPSLDKFRETLPEQCINIGVAEQNMIMFAAGLALSGKKVFCYTIIPFLIYRSYDMIRVNLCLMNLPVTIIGGGAGFSYHPDGPTHHSVEDMAVMRVLPKMTVINPSDSVMASRFSEISGKPVKGPVYLRLDRETLPRLYDDKSDFTRGLIQLKKGRKVCIAATGNMVHKALAIADALEKNGISCGVIDIFRIKPFNGPVFLKMMGTCKYLVSLEEHLMMAGFGSMILETLNETEAKIRFKRFGISDSYTVLYGKRDGLQKKNGLDNDLILRKILNWLKF
jgi:transketolase